MAIIEFQAWQEAEHAFNESFDWFEQLSFSQPGVKGVVIHKSMMSEDSLTGNRGLLPTPSTPNSKHPSPAKNLVSPAQNRERQLNHLPQNMMNTYPKVSPIQPLHNSKQVQQSLFKAPQIIPVAAPKYQMNVGMLNKFSLILNFYFKISINDCSIFYAR